MKPTLLRKNLLLILFSILGITLFAQTPTNAALSSNAIAENEELYTFIGRFTTTDPDQVNGHHYKLIAGEVDNQYFRIRQDSLYSYFSYNYESKNVYSLLVKVQDSTNNVLVKPFTILVTDVTGKYDQNGLADIDIANKYPQVNVGDYIYFNGVGTTNAIYAQTNNAPTVSYPNKVLIRGDSYVTISLGLSQANGTNPSQRVPISNFLGQVYTNSIYLTAGTNWRISGAYDPSLGLGSKYYQGCNQNNESVNFGYSSGQFGIWISREWMDEGTNLLAVTNIATGFEVDHIEISDGGFSGLMLKYDNMNVHSMDDVEVHHMYIHDIGSEGMYIGSTQADPQHIFNNLHIHHCVVLRTGGESIQIGQQSGGCLVENNVLWGAFDWLSPFGQYQDNLFQLDARNGDITIRNNILMGAAGNAFSAFSRTKVGVTPNGQPIRIENNLMWCSRGSTAGYQGGPSDGVTPWNWKDNYAGKFIFDRDRVYTTAVNQPHVLAVGIQNSNIHDTITGNRFDNTRTSFHTLWGGGTVQITASNNLQMTLADPKFRNFIGATDNTNYLTWTRWTATIGEDSGFPATNTNKGQAVTYNVGDVVQYTHIGQTRFYRCIQTHSLQEPEAAGNAYWELLTWRNGDKVSYCPPDDVRLDLGSFYYGKGIGLEGTSSTFLVDAGADRTELASASTIVLEGNAFTPTGTISSYLWAEIGGTGLSLSGTTTQLLTLNSPPIGTYRLKFTATTSTGATASDTVMVYVMEEEIAPIANAGSSIYVTVPASSTTLNGTSSSDPNGQIVAYQWSLLEAPQHPVNPIYVNFTNNSYQALSPWNNSNGILTTGTILPGLTDVSGTATSISIELLDAWDGLNTSGAVTGNNSGIFPDLVLQASYWFQNGTRRLRVFGLNADEYYNFEFLGSRSGSGNRTTIYKIGERQVSLDATNNDSATAQLNWVAADANGEVFVDISKAAGASYGYLNALVVKETGLSLLPTTAPNPNFTGLETGTYLIELTVMDNECLRDMDTVLVTVGTGSDVELVAPSTIYNLYPNPTTGLVNLSIKGVQEVVLTAVIYTVDGKILKQQEIQNQQTSLDLSDYPTGVYFLQLSTTKGNKVWQSKIIIQ